MATSAAAAKRLRHHQGREDARTAIVYAVHGLERGKGCTNQTAPPSPPILEQFTTVLDPSKAMEMSVTAAKRLRCRQGRGDASTKILSLPLSLFWICENDRADCRSITIYQLGTQIWQTSILHFTASSLINFTRQSRQVALTALSMYGHISLNVGLVLSSVSQILIGATLPRAAGSRLSNYRPPNLSHGVARHELSVDIQNCCRLARTPSLNAQGRPPSSSLQRVTCIYLPCSFLRPLSLCRCCGTDKSPPMQYIPGIRILVVE